MLFHNSTGTATTPTVTNENPTEDISNSKAHHPMITAPPPNYMPFPYTKYGPPTCYVGADWDPADIRNQTVPDNTCSQKEKDTRSECYIWPSCKCDFFSVKLYLLADLTVETYRVPRHFPE